MLWIKEVEMVDSLDEWRTSRSVCGKDFPNFKMWDAKIASALDKIIQNFQFKKKVSLEEEKAQREDRFLRGRQIAFMIYDYFRMTAARDTVLDYADLFSVAPPGENIQEFDPRWDEVLLSMSKKIHLMISWKVCTNYLHVSLRSSKTVLDLYDTEIHQKISMPNYQKLKTMVIRKLRLRNFDARHGRIETGAVIKNRTGRSGVEAGGGTCYQWKEKKASVRQNQRQVRHVQKGTNRVHTSVSRVSEHPSSFQYSKKTFRVAPARVVRCS